MLYVDPMAQLRNVAPGQEAGQARRKEVLQEFERVFLYQLLKEMRKTVPEGGLFSNDSRRAFLDEMMDDFVAGEMAQSGQLGLARQLEAQLAVQEQAVADPAPMAALPLQAPPEALRLNAAAAGLPLGKKPGGLALDRGLKAFALRD